MRFYGFFFTAAIPTVYSFGSKEIGKLPLSTHYNNFFSNHNKLSCLSDGSDNIFPNIKKSWDGSMDEIWLREEKNSFFHASSKQLQDKRIIKEKIQLSFEYIPKFLNEMDDDTRDNLTLDHIEKILNSLKETQPHLIEPVRLEFDRYLKEFQGESEDNLHL
jgi:hypothetical protein